MLVVSGAVIGLYIALFSMILVHGIRKILNKPPRQKRRDQLSFNRISLERVENGNKIFLNGRPQR
jgi:hypothetical protein